MAGLILAVTLLSAADVARALDPQDAQCRVVYYAPDGARSETPPSRPYARPPGASASVSSSGAGQASASSSVAASSSGRGGGSAVARTQSDGRTITKSYDNQGCTVVVDDRRAQGD